MATPVPVFPSAVVTDGQLKVANNLVQTTLMAPMGAADTIVFINSIAGFVPNCLVSIDNEIISVSTVTATPPALAVASRGFDGTAAASHSTGAKVSMFIDAWHHNAVAAEIKAIEGFLGPNGANLPSSQLPLYGVYPAPNYVFGAQSPGGSLIVGNNSITLAPVPQGVNGTDSGHVLYVSGGTGTAEAVAITGGSAVAGASSGTVIINCAYAHSGAWTIQTATAGIQEAYQHIVDTASGGTILVKPQTNTIYGKINISHPNIVITGAGWGSIIQAAANAGIQSGLIQTTPAALNFGCYNLTLDGNAINGGTAGNTGVACCLFLGAGAARVRDCQIRNANRSGIFVGDNGTAVNDVLITGCYITGNGGHSGWAAGQLSGYFGLGIFVGGMATTNNVRILSNTIYNNHNFDTGPGDGGAMNITASHVSVIGNYCQDNYNVGGGQIFLVGVGSTGNSPVNSIVSGNEIWCSGRFGSPQDITGGIECQSAGLTITGNYIHDTPAGYGILLDPQQPAAPASGPTTIANNAIVNVQDGIGIHSSDVSYYIGHVNITGNTVSNASQYAVVVFQVNDYIFIKDNDLTGVSQAIASSTLGTHCAFMDNYYSPGLPPANITMGASPMTFANGPYRQVVAIMGAATLSVVLQGAINIGANTGSWTYVLDPNDVIIITYTGSPTMTAKPV